MDDQEITKETYLQHLIRHLVDCGEITEGDMNAFNYYFKDKSLKDFLCLTRLELARLMSRCINLPPKAQVVISIAMTTVVPYREEQLEEIKHQVVDVKHDKKDLFFPIASKEENDWGMFW